MAKNRSKIKDSLTIGGYVAAISGAFFVFSEICAGILVLLYAFFEIDKFSLTTWAFLAAVVAPPLIWALVKLLKVAFNAERSLQQFSQTTR